MVSSFSRDGIRVYKCGSDWCETKERKVVRPVYWAVMPWMFWSTAGTQTVWIYLGGVVPDYELIVVCVMSLMGA